VLELTALSWNLFHGRDAPPDPRSKRNAWRLSRQPIDDGTYLNVNHSLMDEFAALISASSWSICLLQEAPPAWTHALARQSGGDAFRSLTSRNQFARITQGLARRRPDLLGSWEGGSNTTLVRPPWQVVPGSTRDLLLNPLSERGLGERRRMAFARLRGPENGDVCVANLHAGGGSRRATQRQVLRAAKAALEWASGSPLLFGGDFNLRPHTSPEPFRRLERELGFTAPTAVGAIDHLLARGLSTATPTRVWADEEREMSVPWQGGTRRIRLSDHAPIQAVFTIENPRMR
jgi:endonuclease/exonuclease/phosphatase family metal-dependent hydrolase